MNVRWSSCHMARHEERRLVLENPVAEDHARRIRGAKRRDRASTSARAAVVARVDLVTREFRTAP